MPVRAFVSTWIVPALRRMLAPAYSQLAATHSVSGRQAWSTAPGYVGCGLLVLAACEAAHDGTWLIDRDWPAQRISMYLTLAYYVGQFLAIVSESRLVGRWLVPVAAARASRQARAEAGGELVFTDHDSGDTAWSDWSRVLCLGLWLAAASLLGGAAWHGVDSRWGQSDWRKLGYALPALFGAWLLPRLLSRRRSLPHQQWVGST